MEVRGSLRSLIRLKSRCRPKGLTIKRVTGKMISVQKSAKKIVRLVSSPKCTVGRKLANALEANPAQRIMVETSIDWPVLRYV